MCIAIALIRICSCLKELLLVLHALHPNAVLGNDSVGDFIPHLAHTDEENYRS